MPTLQYPNEFVPKAEKEKSEYGRMFFFALWNSYGGWKAYTEKRNRLLDLRRWRAGGQTIEDMKDIMGASDTSWYNLDWTPNRIIANKSDTVISYLDSIPFKVLCEGADPLSITEKDNMRMKLYAKAMVKPMREQLEQSMGMKFGLPTEYEPEDAEDVDLYMQGEHKLSVEIGMEEAIKYFMKLNGFKDIKRQILEDLWTVGAGVVYNEFDGETIKCNYVNYPDLIVPITKNQEFKNAKYGAHVEWLTLGDIYKEAGDSISLSDYERIANVSYDYTLTGQWGQLVGNGQYYGSAVYNNEWNNLDVPVVRGEFRSTNITTYNVRTNGLGRKVVGEYATNNKNVEKVQKDWEDVYKGSYIPDVDLIYNYGRKKNMPRNKIGDKYDLTGVLGYCIFQPINYDNFNVSPVMRMQPAAKKIQLIELQMQHLIAKSTPGGYSLNIDVLAETITKIKGVETEMDLYKLFIQYGVMFYSGQKEDGSPLPPPINYIQGIDFSQIKGLVDTYQFYVNELERSIGGAAVGMGSAPEERTGLGVQQLAQQAADNALGYIKFGLESVVIRTATMFSRFIQMMHRDKKFDFYALAYGKENIQAIKDMENLELRDYNIFINYEVNIGEQQANNEMLKEAVAKGTLLPEQEMWLRLIGKESPKLSMIYMRRERKKQAKEQAANAQSTFQAQQQSAQVAEQAKMQSELAIINAKLEADKQLKMLDVQIDEKRHKWKMEEIGLQVGMKNKGDLDVAIAKTDGRTEEA